MKIKVYIKDPDGFSNAINDSICEELNKLPLNNKEKDAILEIRSEEVEDKLSKWVESNECVTLEFDLDTGIASVLPK